MCFSEPNVTTIVQSRKLLLCTIVCLLLGSAIYILFRNDVVFIKIIGIDYRNIYELAPSFLTYFVLYNLSDMLWALALMCFLCTQTSYVVKILGIIIPVALECAQLLDACPGTFDIIDLSIYIILSSVFYTKWKLKKEL